MISNLSPSAEEFRAYINSIDDFVLEVFIEEITRVMMELENEDFFGDEGWAGRYG